MLPNIQLDPQGRIQQVWVSAQQGQGLDLLEQALRQHFDIQCECIWLRLPPSAGHIRSELYAKDHVVQEFVDDEGHWQIEAEIPVQRVKHFADYQIAVQSEQLAG